MPAAAQKVPPPKSLEPWFKDPEHWGIPDARWFDHQVTGIRWMAERRSVLLNDDMGLAKTSQALATFCLDIKRGRNTKDGRKARCIVVCPGSVKVNWGYEIEQFTRLNYVVTPSESAKRMRELKRFDEMDDPKILVVNYEQLTPLLDWLNGQHFDMAIFDESHMIKTPVSKRARAARALRSRRSLLLTGTPVLLDVRDLWSQLDRVAPGQFMSYGEFENRYAVFGVAKGGRRKVTGIQRGEELRERMKPYVLARKKEDVLDLPGVQKIWRRVGMTTDQARLYSGVETEMLADYEQGLPGAGAGFLKLLQVCGTTAAVDPDTDSSEKLAQAVEDAVELVDGGHPVVVFTSWRSVHASFCKRLTRHGRRGSEDSGRYRIFELHGGVPMDKRQGVLNEWKRYRSPEGRPGVLVATYHVANVGLNMTHARHMLRLDRTFVDALNNQAIDRLNRIGASKTQKVQVFDYLVTGSVEERVEWICQAKGKTAEKVSFSAEEMLSMLMAERAA